MKGLYLVKATIKEGKEKDLLKLLESEGGIFSLEFVLRNVIVSNGVIQFPWAPLTRLPLEKQLGCFKDYLGIVDTNPIDGYYFREGELLLDYLKRSQSKTSD